MIYGYIRVSTDKQTVENQEFELIKFTKRHGMKIDHWIKETVSGVREVDERKLGKLLKRLKKGDIVLASELSRLGRNLFQVMGILHYCMSKEVQVWTIKDNYRLGTDIQSKVLAFAFGLSAEIERNLISQRTKEALARIKAEGRKLGRPKGMVCRRKLDGKERQLAQLLASGLSKGKTARKVGVSRMTIYNFLNATGGCKITN